MSIFRRKEGLRDYEKPSLREVIVRCEVCGKPLTVRLRGEVEFVHVPGHRKPQGGDCIGAGTEVKLDASPESFISPETRKWQGGKLSRASRDRRDSDPLS